MQDVGNQCDVDDNNDDDDAHEDDNSLTSSSLNDDDVFDETVECRMLHSATRNWVAPGLNIGPKQTFTNIRVIKIRLLCLYTKLNIGPKQTFENITLVTFSNIIEGGHITLQLISNRLLQA